MSKVLEVTVFLSEKFNGDILLGSPALKKAFSRGNSPEKEAGSPIDFLFSLLNVNNKPGQDKPFAAVTAQVDFAEDEEDSINFHERIWIRADPVFLHADLTSLLLFDSQKFSLSKEEVAGFFSIINPVLAEDGLCLTCGNEPSRWYIQVKDQPSITTTIPSEVDGRDIRPFLPEGKDRAYWVRLSNEIQMLLHDCSINMERQQRGELPINSVWLWGAGKLPDQKERRFDLIISDDINAQGLAKVTRIPHEKISDDFSHFLEARCNEQKILIVLSQGDLALSRAEHHLEDYKKLSLLDPLLSALKKNKIRQLEIITDDQHRVIRRSHLYRFWRRDRVSNRRSKQ